MRRRRGGAGRGAAAGRGRKAGELRERAVGEQVEMGFEIDVVEGEAAIDDLVREASGP